MARGGTGRAGRIHHAQPIWSAAHQPPVLTDAERFAHVEGVNAILAANPGWRLMEAVMAYEVERDAPDALSYPSGDLMTDWVWDIEDAVMLLRAGAPLVAENWDGMTPNAQRIYAELVECRERVS